MAGVSSPVTGNERARRSDLLAQRDGGGGADGGGLADQGVPVRPGLGVEQDDDAVVVALVEHLRRDQHALTGAAAPVLDRKSVV